MPSLRRLAILAVILIYVFQVERVHPVAFFGQFQDGSIYFSIAKVLADGQAYNLISFPGASPTSRTMDGRKFTGSNYRIQFWKRCIT